MQVVSTLGRGTRVTLVIPLTLAVLDGMVVAVGWEKYILPLTSIVESFRPDRGQIRSVPGGGEVASIRGEFVRLVHLARLFGVREAIDDPSQGLVVLIETLGTNALAPAAPHPRLAEFYQLLQSRYGLRQTALSTDYRFASPAEAADVLGFFFGDPMRQAVRAANSAVVPEWTGVWHGPLPS